MTRLEVYQSKDKHRQYRQEQVPVDDIHPTDAELHEFANQSNATITGYQNFIHALGRNENLIPILLRDIDGELWLDASTHGKAGSNNLAYLMALRRVDKEKVEAIIYTEKSIQQKMRKQTDGDYTLSPNNRERLRNELRDMAAAIIAAIGFISEDDLYKIALAGAQYGSQGGELLSSSDIHQIAREALDFNADYADNFKDDAHEIVDELVESSYTSEQDFIDAVENAFSSFSSRAERYAVGGGQQAWKDGVRAGAEANGTDKCFWNCKFVPGTCADCIALHGQLMTWDEFDEIFGDTICNGGCQCSPVPSEENMSLDDLEEEAA